ncbi:MAG: hypothetical protein KC592_06495, partial [Nitrospira sp.]|nr:hypothetical protein [Nitrospira sp.]
SVEVYAKWSEISTRAQGVPRTGQEAGGPWSPRLLVVEPRGAAPPEHSFLFISWQLKVEKARVLL